MVGSKAKKDSFLLIFGGIIYISGFFVVKLFISSENYVAYGQSLFIALVTIPLTFYLTNFCFNYRSRRKWNKISNKVLNNLNYELSGLFYDVGLFCGFNMTDFTPSANTSKEDLENELLEKRLDQFKKIAHKESIKIVSNQKNILLEGSCGEIFKKRADYFDQFQLKYLSYLEADIIIALMDLQKALHQIDQIINIRNRQIRNDWIRIHSDEDIIKSIESDMKSIINILKYLLDKNFFNPKSEVPNISEYS